MVNDETKSPQQANFDRVARLYRWAEYLALGPVLQRLRIHFLSELGDRRSALVLGDGDGRFLAELMARDTEIEATAVDTSSLMLQLLRGRCAFARDRLCTEQTSALKVTPPATTDLVVSHFFLDCLEEEEVEQLIQTIAKGCEPGTVWLISDFQVPAHGWKKPAGALYVRLLYFAFRFLTGLKVQHLPETRDVLRSSGFQRTHYRERLGGLLYTELWRLGERR